MSFALIAFTYTMFHLPETKGRTFDDIVAEFRGTESIPLDIKKGFNTFTWTRSRYIYGAPFIFTTCYWAQCSLECLEFVQINQ